MDLIDGSFLLEACRDGVPGEASLDVRHPLSGACRITGPLHVDAETIRRTFAAFGEGMGTLEQRSLACWRRLPEELARNIPIPVHLPTDMDAIGCAGERALLTVSIGPVQGFIAAARTVRDLWSGSAILSWLTWQAMTPIVEEFGPWAVVFPALRGNPLTDLWLIRKGLAKCLPMPEADARKSPSFPNRFLAIVPCGTDGAEARNVAARCEEACKYAWKRLADAVRKSLEAKFDGRSDGWDRLWDAQMDTFPDVAWTVLPERACDDERLSQLRDGAAVEDRWQAMFEVLGRSLDARRSIRPLPVLPAATDAEGKVAAKCTLTGILEQMGPADREAANAFWDRAENDWQLHGVGLRKGDRLSAPALVKRFAAPALLAKEMDIAVDALRFPDTATVAAWQWLKKHDGIDWRAWQASGSWSGQWLHWPRRDFDRGETPCPNPLWEKIKTARTDGPPPAYYAILAMDGDNMGQWLMGGMGAASPLRGAARHAAISEALTNFSCRIAPPIVSHHGGTLIYAGGDDVLALLPTATALACARELRLAFSGDPRQNAGADEGWYHANGRALLTMGAQATASAGIAVIHYKDDLRGGLEAARAAEKAAKAAGRNRLALAALRRSGEHATSVCSWDIVPRIDDLVRIFLDGATDRWAYRLRRLLPPHIAEGLPPEALESEVKRQIQKTEKPEALEKLVPGMMRDFLDGQPGRSNAFEAFIVLCQSASFLARGRDQ